MEKPNRDGWEILEDMDESPKGNFHNRRKTHSNYPSATGPKQRLQHKPGAHIETRTQTHFIGAHTPVLKRGRRTNQ